VERFGIEKTLFFLENIRVKLSVDNGDGLNAPADVELTASLIPLDNGTKEISKEPVMFSV
jgi:hypothetical protein